jgi:hypothetical protein
MFSSFFYLPRSADSELVFFFTRIAQIILLFFVVVGQFDDRMRLASFTADCSTVRLRHIVGRIYGGGGGRGRRKN